MSHPIKKDMSFQLKDGCEWSDHEDCLIGNAKGIEALRDACDLALKDGAYYGSDLGDYVGVKVLENAWFDNPEESASSNLANLIGGSVVVVLLVTLAVGLFTIGRAIIGIFT
jgi:hypothetical protein